MRLYHASPAYNVRSIMTCGVLTSRSMGKLSVVWLHTSSRQAWAALHTVRRHGGRVEDVVVFSVDVPRSHLVRFSRGLWYCKRDVYVSEIGGYATFGDLSR